MGLNFVICIQCEINKGKDYTFTLLAKQIHFLKHFWLYDTKSSIYIAQIGILNSKSLKHLLFGMLNAEIGTYKYICTFKGP